MRKSDQRRLTPDDWARAALAAIARGGVDAVAVETIAREVGATKGSFYWHFKNRDALIDAALTLWEQRTDVVIQALESEPVAATRLRTLVQAGIAAGPSERVEIALLANPGHPGVLRAVRRVARRRISYIAEQLQQLGWGPRQAEDRATLLYYVYVGHMQMAHAAPRLTTDDERRRQVEVAFDALVMMGGRHPPPHRAEAVRSSG